jgi:hypothetical protein
MSNESRSNDLGLQSNLAASVRMAALGGPLLSSARTGIHRGQPSKLQSVRRMTLFWQRRSRRGRHDSPRFTVGQHVILARDLSAQRVNEEGMIRGLTPTPDGTNYAIRFQDGMLIVHERDLRNPNLNDVPPNQMRGQC